MKKILLLLLSLIFVLSLTTAAACSRDKNKDNITNEQSSTEESSVDDSTVDEEPKLEFVSTNDIIASLEEKAQKLSFKDVFLLSQGDITAFADLFKGITLGDLIIPFVEDYIVVSHATDGNWYITADPYNPTKFNPITNAIFNYEMGTGKPLSLSEFELQYYGGQKIVNVFGSQFGILNFDDKLMELLASSSTTILENLLSITVNDFYAITNGDYTFINNFISKTTVDEMLVLLGELFNKYVTGYESLVLDVVELLQVMLDGTLETIHIDGYTYVTELIDAARKILAENIEDYIIAKYGEELGVKFVELAHVILDEADKHYHGVLTRDIFNVIPYFDVDATIYSLGEAVKVFVKGHKSIVDHTVELLQVMLDGTLETSHIDGYTYVSDLICVIRTILNDNIEDYIIAKYGEELGVKFVELANVVLDEADMHYVGVLTRDIFNVIPYFDVDEIIKSLGKAVKVFVPGHESIVENTVALLQTMLDGTLTTTHLDETVDISEVVEQAKIFIFENLNLNSEKNKMFDEMEELFNSYITGKLGELTFTGDRVEDLFDDLIAIAENYSETDIEIECIKEVKKLFADVQGKDFQDALKSLYVDDVILAVINTALILEPSYEELIIATHNLLINLFDCTTSNAILDSGLQIDVLIDSIKDIVVQFVDSDILMAIFDELAKLYHGCTISTVIKDTRYLSIDDVVSSIANVLTCLVPSDLRPLVIDTGFIFSIIIDGTFDKIEIDGTVGVDDVFQALNDVVTNFVEPSVVSAILEELTKLYAGVKLTDIRDCTLNIAVDEVTISLFNVLQEIYYGQDAEVLLLAEEFLLWSFDGTLGSPVFDDMIYIVELIRPFRDLAEIRDEYFYVVLLEELENLYSHSRVCEFGEYTKDIDVHELIDSLIIVCEEATGNEALHELEDIYHELFDGTLAKTEINADYYNKNAEKTIRELLIEEDIEIELLAKFDTKLLETTIKQIAENFENDSLINVTFEEFDSLFLAGNLKLFYAEFGVQELLKLSIVDILSISELTMDDMIALYQGNASDEILNIIDKIPLINPIDLYNFILSIQ